MQKRKKIMTQWQQTIAKFAINTLFCCWVLMLFGWWEVQGETPLFPPNMTDKTQKILQKAPYDKIYLQVDPTDYKNFVEFPRDDDDEIPVTWALVDFSYNKKFRRDGSLIEKIWLWIPQNITTFGATIELRWSLSMKCIKPSFKIENDDIDLDIKLKSMCWARLWVEEYIFWQIMNNVSSPNLHPFHVFMPKQEYKIVYINWKLLGLYLHVPTFNSSYLDKSNIIDPDKDRNCILKAGRFIVPGTGNKKDIPISSRLKVFQDFDDITLDEADHVLEEKYGDDEKCMNDAKEIIEVVNNTWKNRDDLNDFFHTESVLFWWLSLLNSDNLISLTHNYLFVKHKDKYAMWYRDIENFNWCHKRSIDDYQNNRDRKYNLLFDKVLQYYQENNPTYLASMETKVRNILCNDKSYAEFFSYDLPYPIADRFARWLNFYEKNSDTINEKHKYWNNFIAFYKTVRTKIRWTISTFANIISMK